MNSSTAERALALVEALELVPEDEIWILIDPSTGKARGWGYTVGQARRSAACRFARSLRPPLPMVRGAETDPDPVERCLPVRVTVESSHALELLGALGLAGDPEPGAA